MNLSANFTYEELTHTSHRDLDNVPSEIVLLNMKTLLCPVLEKIRTYLGGKPMTITSGYRSLAVNTAVGGSKTSGHMEGLCADFICPAFGTPTQIVRALAQTDLAYDQLITEGTWVHVSADPRTRMMLMTAHFTPGGATTYTQGA